MYLDRSAMNLVMYPQSNRFFVLLRSDFMDLAANTHHFFGSAPTEHVGLYLIYC